jgi:hypothetical protein
MATKSAFPSFNFFRKKLWNDERPSCALRVSARVIFRKRKTNGRRKSGRREDDRIKYPGTRILVPPVGDPTTRTRLDGFFCLLRVHQ